MEIVGVDVSQAVGGATFDAVLDAFHAQCVLIFRQQNLTPESLIAFSRRFGELDTYIDARYQLEGYPEITVVGNVVKDGRYVSLFVHIEPEWHSDGSFMKRPNLGSLLYCVEAPPEGADTLFSSMYAAYDALPDETKRPIQGLRAVHSYETLDRYERTLDPDRPPLTDEQRREAPPVTHPIVRTHPVTGRKALYVCRDVISHVEGMSEDRGRDLVRELADHVTQPRFVYRHKWRKGDLVVWDNRCTMHSATPFDAQKYRRVMWRTTLIGDVPY